MLNRRDWEEISTETCFLWVVPQKAITTVEDSNGPSPVSTTLAMPALPFSLIVANLYYRYQDTGKVDEVVACIKDTSEHDIKSINNTGNSNFAGVIDTSEVCPDSKLI
jgi:hypothetical protein